MEILTFWALLLSAMLGIFSYILLVALLKVINRLAEVNKALLIFVAGKDGKVETLRALIASDRIPKKKVPGIVEKGDPEKPKNVDYQMKVGVT